MTELVEQGDHFVMGKQRRLPFTGRLKLQVRYATGFCSDRRLYASGLRSHPSTPRRACFTGIQVEVEATAQFVVLVIYSKKRTSGCQTSTSLRSLAVSRKYVSPLQTSR